MNVNTVLRLLVILPRLHQHESWTRQQLEAYQTQKLAELRQYAYRHSPFYQQFHHGLYDRPLCDLPVLTKNVMMEHFDEVMTNRAIHLEDIRMQRELDPQALYLGRYRVNTTSGSTGSPGLFLFSEREWAMVLASFVRGYEWAGVHVNLAQRRRVAIVASVNERHMSAQVSRTLQSLWAATRKLSASEPVPAIVRELNDWQPDILVAYASMARILALEQLEQRLQIAPETVFTSSEVLTDEARRLIEMAWGKAPFDQYAATETAGIAAECEHHSGLHLYEDLVIVENVDEQYRPVPAGIYGDRLLVTVLFNRTQPLIRYEINDSLKFTDRRCGCGRPFALVEAVQGREQDSLQIPGAQGDVVTVHPNVFHDVMDMVSVSAWQIVQREDGLHILLVDPRATVNDDALTDALRHALQRQGVQIPMLFIQRVATIPRTAGGKAPLIKAELSHPIGDHIR